MVLDAHEFQVALTFLAQQQTAGSDLLPYATVPGTSQILPFLPI